MGVKEDGLVFGSYVFIAIFLVGALLIGEYSAFTTKDRTAAGANRG